ncbi:MAG: fimA [Blastococcus sp.]|nr:fimA [Blastococcus sp.]
MSRARTTVTAALLAASLSGCGSSESGDGAAIASGDPSLCPGEVVDVLVSVGSWSDMTRRLGGDCANVTTVVSSGSVDPHEVDPGTADLAAFSGADLVVLNGAGYDEWAADALAALDREPVVVDAASVAGIADHGDDDPHLWYDPEILALTAEAVSGALADLSPDAVDYFDHQLLAWQEELQPYSAAVAELRSTAAGAGVAATETVFDRMSAAVGLVDVTPAGYRRAGDHGSEPSPGDVSAFEAALADGRVDVLIHNTQTGGSVPEQLRAAAEDADVPVVEVTEAPADTDSSFVAWQLDQLSELTDALAGRR